MSVASSSSSSEDVSGSTGKSPLPGSSLLSAPVWSASPAEGRDVMRSLLGSPCVLSDGCCPARFRLSDCSLCSLLAVGEALALGLGRGCIIIPADSASANAIMTKGAYRLRRRRSGSPLLCVRAPSSINVGMYASQSNRSTTYTTYSLNLVILLKTSFFKQTPP